MDSSVKTGNEAADGAIAQLLELGIAYGLPLLLDVLENGIGAVAGSPRSPDELRLALMNTRADLIEARGAGPAAEGEQ